MADLCKLSSENNTLKLHGVVNMDTANRLLQDFRQQLGSGINTLDCENVSEADSAAISLLLACISHAQAQQIELHLSGMGEQLLNLARLYEVEQLLDK